MEQMEKIQGTMKDIITRLEKKGVQTRAIWGLIHEQFPYRHETVYKIEKASYYSKRILNIPSSTQLTEEDIKYSANAVKEVLEELSR